MGGHGSSRWQGHSKRPLVEDSFVLDCAALSQAGVLDSSEKWKVDWELQGEKIASVVVSTLRLPNGRRELLLAYAHKADHGESTHNVAEGFTLERVRMGVAGDRWFFKCP